MKRALCILLFVSHMVHAMHEACREGNVAEVAKLLASNPEQLTEMKNGGLPIHCAAYGGSPDVIKLVLDAKPELVNEPDARGNVPFNHVFMAIADWQAKVRTKGVVETILMMGILQQRSPSQEFKDAQEKKMKSFKATIQLFIERGAQLDKRNDNENTWDEMPGVDKGWITYARSIKSLQNE